MEIIGSSTLLILNKNISSIEEYENEKNEIKEYIEKENYKYNCDFTYGDFVYYYSENYIIEYNKTLNNFITYSDKIISHTVCEENYIANLVERTYYKNIFDITKTILKEKENNEIIVYRNKIYIFTKMEYDIMDNNGVGSGNNNINNDNINNDNDNINNNKIMYKYRTIEKF